MLAEADHAIPVETALPSQQPDGLVVPVEPISDEQHVMNTIFEIRMLQGGLQTVTESLERVNARKDEGHIEDIATSLLLQGSHHAIYTRLRQAEHFLQQYQRRVGTPFQIGSAEPAGEVALFSPAPAEPAQLPAPEIMEQEPGQQIATSQENGAGTLVPLTHAMQEDQRDYTTYTLPSGTEIKGNHARALHAITELQRRGSDITNRSIADLAFPHLGKPSRVTQVYASVGYLLSISPQKGFELKKRESKGKGRGNPGHFDFRLIPPEKVTEQQPETTEESPADSPHDIELVANPTTDQPSHHGKVEIPPSEHASLLHQSSEPSHTVIFLNPHPDNGKNEIIPTGRKNNGHRDTATGEILKNSSAMVRAQRLGIIDHSRFEPNRTDSAVRRQLVSEMGAEATEDEMLEVLIEVVQKNPSVQRVAWVRKRGKTEEIWGYQWENYFLPTIKEWKKKKEEKNNRTNGKASAAKSISQVADPDDDGELVADWDIYPKKKVG